MGNPQPRSRNVQRQVDIIGNRGRAEGRFQNHRAAISLDGEAGHKRRTPHDNGVGAPEGAGGILCHKNSLGAPSNRRGQGNAVSRFAVDGKAAEARAPLSGQHSLVGGCRDAEGVVRGRPVENEGWGVAIACGHGDVVEQRGSPNR